MDVTWNTPPVFWAQGGLADLDLPRAGGDHRRVLAVLRFPEGNGWPRAPAEGPADARAAKMLVCGAGGTG